MWVETKSEELKLPLYGPRKVRIVSNLCPLIRSFRGGVWQQRTAKNWNVYCARAMPTCTIKGDGWKMPWIQERLKRSMLTSSLLWIGRRKRPCHGIKGRGSGGTNTYIFSNLLLSHISWPVFNKSQRFRSLSTSHTLTYHSYNESLSIYPWTVNSVSGLGHNTTSTIHTPKSTFLHWRPAPLHTALVPHTVMTVLHLLHRTTPSKEPIVQHAKRRNSDEDTNQHNSPLDIDLLVSSRVSRLMDGLKHW